MSGARRADGHDMVAAQQEAAQVLKSADCGEAVQSELRTQTSCRLLFPLLTSSLAVVYHVPNVLPSTPTTPETPDVETWSVKESGVCLVTWWSGALS